MLCCACSYGQTETSAASHMTCPGDMSVGHVGIPLPCTEVMLEDVPDMKFVTQRRWFGCTPRWPICICCVAVFLCCAQLSDDGSPTSRRSVLPRGEHFPSENRCDVLRFHLRASNTHALVCFLIWVSVARAISKNPRRLVKPCMTAGCTAVILVASIRTARCPLSIVARAS